MIITSKDENVFSQMLKISGNCVNMQMMFDASYNIISVFCGLPCFLYRKAKLMAK